MKKVLILLGFCLLCVPLFAAETSIGEIIARVETKPLKTDLELIAIPIRARSIKVGGTIDVLEKPAAEMPPVLTRRRADTEGGFQSGQKSRNNPSGSDEGCG